MDMDDVQIGLSRIWNRQLWTTVEQKIVQLGFMDFQLLSQFSEDFGPVWEYIQDNHKADIRELKNTEADPFTLFSEIAEFTALETAEIALSNRFDFHEVDSLSPFRFPNLSRVSLDLTNCLYMLDDELDQFKILIKGFFSSLISLRSLRIVTHNWTFLTEIISWIPKKSALNGLIVQVAAHSRGQSWSFSQSLSPFTSLETLILSPTYRPDVNEFRQFLVSTQPIRSNLRILGTPSCFTPFHPVLHQHFHGLKRFEVWHSDDEKKALRGANKIAHPVLPNACAHFHRRKESHLQCEKKQTEQRNEEGREEGGGGDESDSGITSYDSKLAQQVDAYDEQKKKWEDEEKSRKEIADEKKEALETRLMAMEEREETIKEQRKASRQRVKILRSGRRSKTAIFGF